jgi:hypothetical protein
MNKITIDKIPELVAKCKKTFDSIREYSKMNAKNYLNGTVTKATKIIVDVYNRTNLELAFTSLVEYLSYYGSKQYAEYYMLLHSDKSTEREKLMTEIIYCTIENGLLVHIHSEDTKSIVDIVCDLKESRWALNTDGRNSKGSKSRTRDDEKSKESNEIRLFCPLGTSLFGRKE